MSDKNNNGANESNQLEDFQEEIEDMKIDLQIFIGKQLAAAKSEILKEVAEMTGCRLEA
jgi:hypothetical protein